MHENVRLNFCTGTRSEHDHTLTSTALVILFTVTVMSYCDQCQGPCYVHEMPATAAVFTAAVIIKLLLHAVTASNSS